MENSTLFTRADRDMLIVLNTKVDQLTIDIKGMRDDLVIRITRAESRLDAMDVFHAGIPMKKYEILANWVENYRSNLKFIMFAGGLCLGVLGAVIERILQTIFHF